MVKQITGNSPWKRVLSFCMALALILALFPAAVFSANAAAPGKLYLVPNKNWKAANARFAAYFFGNGEKWVSMTDADGDGVYEVEVPSGYPSVIFCRMAPDKLQDNWNNMWNQTADLTIPTNGTNCYTVKEDSWDKDGGTWSTVTADDSDDTDETTAPTQPDSGAARTVKVHYRNTGAWTKVNCYAWNQATEDVLNGTWPGAAISATEGHANWYTITLNNVTTPNLGVIFNNGSAQTDNILLNGIPETGAEYWYDGALTTTAPSTWEDGSVTTTQCNVTLHFADTKGWGNVSLYTWTGSANPTGSWPGTKAGLDADGFYTLSFTAEVVEGQPLNFIFNNGGNGAQTVDLEISAADIATGSVERWVKPGDEFVDDNADTIKYNAEIVTNGAAIAMAPKVKGTSVTIQYKAENASKVEVFGTMNSWASGYAMTKNAYGVWSVTIDNLTPGTHRYKVVVDGDWELDDNNSWQYTESDGKVNSAFMILNPNAVDNNKITVNFHYYRPDGNYTGWNLWIWTLSGAADQYDFETVNGEQVASITVKGRATQYISFIPRCSTTENKWAAQEGGERRVDLSDVVSGTIDYYITSDNTSGGMRVLNTDVVQENKISSIELDYDKDQIYITTNKAVSDPENDFVIKDITDAGSDVAITSVTASGSTYTIKLNKAMDLVNLHKYQFNFRDQKAYTDYGYSIGINTVYASQKFGNEFTYTGDDLGATYTANATSFRLWAPTASAVAVKLYATGSDQEMGAAELGSYAMTKDVNGTWILTIERDLNKVYYTYLVTRDGVTVEAVDPYARTTGVNGLRGMVIDMDQTNPTGWASDTDPNPLTSYTDAIIYELHVRDFSIDDSSGVKDEWQGKFLGLTQTGTTTKNGTTTGLDYLKSLGITHLHLLPVYDYASVNETMLDVPQFNWGYDPLNYNVPEGSYSTDPYKGEVRVQEFKQMVQALHNSDISVVMDVVYNHVYDAGIFSINQIVPGYFSRTNVDGSYSNGSGCGNDTASEREMVRKYIVDSVNYWASEYHVDGFRFDLVGLLDSTTINQIVDTVHEQHPNALFYGEGWTMGTAVEPGNTMATQANSAATPKFAYFSDTMRNLLAGENGKSTGFVSGSAGREAEIAANFMAEPWWTKNPAQIVQYASCHDNYTLVDKLIISTGRTEIDDQIIKMNNLAAAIYLTSQGIPFIHAGEEFLREKVEIGGGRCENSYNASDFVNHIEWSNLDDATYMANSNYYKGLIAFRKAHPALRLAIQEQVGANVTTLKAAGNVVAMQVNGGVNGETAEAIVVIYNAGNSAATVSLPAGTWNICIDDDQAGVASLGTASGSVSVPGISAMVLVKGDITCAHDWKDATCEEPKTCGLCGATEGEALGHNMVDGVCSVCGEADSGEESDTVTIYFQNNWFWSDISVYYWGTGSEPVWPGNAMTLYGNDGNYDIYAYEVPANATGFLINGTKDDGSGAIDKTPDITEGYYDGICYYMKWDNGNQVGSEDISVMLPEPEVLPTITLSGLSLSYEDEIYYNVYYDIDDDTDVVEMGMLMWNSQPEEISIGTADQVVPGAYSSNRSNRYSVRTNGIPAKNMADQLYMAVYAKLSDGTYVYSACDESSAKAYAEYLLKDASTKESVKALCVAMLNYGAAAQQYFADRDGNTVEKLMNSDLTAEQQALAEAYRSDMAMTIPAVDPAKVGSFAATETGFGRNMASVQLEGAFAINCYFTPSVTPADGVKLYCWSQENYEAAEVLTAENATCVVDMTQVGSQFRGSYTGIAAKEFDEAVYFCGVYEADGVTYSTGVLATSLAWYGNWIAANSSNAAEQALAEAIVVYGYYAKNHFAN